MEPIPVALFEPRKVLAATDTTTRRTVDIQIEAICQAGFPRFAPVVAQIDPVDGWAVRRGRDGLELVDPGGSVWAAADISPAPYWLSAAASRGSVLVLYGVRLGVRQPPGAGRYGPAERAAEVRDGRRLGLTAAALVKWQA